MPALPQFVILSHANSRIISLFPKALLALGYYLDIVPEKIIQAPVPHRKWDYL